ncbi:MAG: hypothetical protein PHE55_22030, partial [Methylococcaceae bacterium]|nr:hypothetical protein [Methylococcaceae bacterium]
AGIVDEESVLLALDSANLHAYVSDFPSVKLKDHHRVIALPHLGASTEEAEVNCAVMVTGQIRDFLENGSIKNAVNFPDVELPRTENFRLALANANVPNVVSQVSSRLADANLNIAGLVNRSRGDLAYTLLDVDAEIPEETLSRIQSIEGVLAARVIN